MFRIRLLAVVVVVLLGPPLSSGLGYLLGLLL